VNQRHGSPAFYNLLEEMAHLHDIKSHDYADDSNPYGNYHFAGLVANLFAHSSHDAGFAGRLAEKIYRLAVLEGGRKEPKNESIIDSERDIGVITLLWMADRQDRRLKANQAAVSQFTTDSAEFRNRISEIAGKLHPNDLRFLHEYIGELMAIRQGYTSESPSQALQGGQ
jgi:hypothetical protein